MGLQSSAMVLRESRLRATFAGLRRLLVTPSGVESRLREARASLEAAVARLPQDEDETTRSHSEVEAGDGVAQPGYARS